MSAADTLPIVDETHRLVRLRSFPSSTDLRYLAQLLRLSHATGTLMIDFSCGGVGTIRFREEQELAPE